MTFMLADIFDMMFQAPNPIFIIGGTIAIVAIVCGSATKIVVSRSREKTRREIAAYVAEGTIDADKAIEMLRAETEDAGCCGDG